MAEKVWVGIDPGKKGAFAAIYEGGEVVTHHTPVNVVRKKRARKKTPSGKPSYSSSTLYDLTLMFELFNQLARRVRARRLDVSVLLERQGPRRRDGKKQVFQTGRGVGLWEMACAGNGLSYDFVTPTEWKGKYVAKGADKTASITACRARATSRASGT